MSSISECVGGETWRDGPPSPGFGSSLKDGGPLKRG